MQLTKDRVLNSSNANTDKVNALKSIFTLELDNISSGTSESAISFFLPQGAPSSDQIARRDVFAFELNMGLLLPFAAKPTLYKNEKGGYDPQVTRVELPTENGIIIQSATLYQSMGEPYKSSTGKDALAIGKPLSAFDQLVFLSLMNLAFRRMGKSRDLDGRTTQNRLYFQSSELCTDLGRSVNQVSYVNKSIDNLFAQKIAFDTFLQKVEGTNFYKASEQKSTKLIVARGFISGGYYNERGQLVKGKAIQYIDFEDSIAKGILNNQDHGTIPKAVMGKLRVNAEIRLMTYLQSKRKYFNNAPEFVVTVNEIINQCNLQNKRKKDLKGIVTEYLENCSKAAGFTYFYDEKKSQFSEDFVYINFSQNTMITYAYNDPHCFYEILLSMYTDLINKNFFMDHEIDRGFINQTIQDYESIWEKERKAQGKDVICTFNGLPVNPAEFVFDCLLFQVQEGYEIKKSFKALYRKMFSDLVEDKDIKHDLYREFVRYRFKKEKEKELNLRIEKTKQTDREIKDYRERLVETNFRQYYKFRVENNKKLLPKLKKYFIDNKLVDDEPMEILVLDSIREVCFEKWRNLELDPLLNKLDPQKKKLPERLDEDKFLQ